MVLIALEDKLDLGDAVRVCVGGGVTSTLVKSSLVSKVICYSGYLTTYVSAVAVLLTLGWWPSHFLTLSPAHRSTDAEERRRVKNAGGKVLHGRVMGVLEPSRVIGVRVL